MLLAVGVQRCPGGLVGAEVVFGVFGSSAVIPPTGTTKCRAGSGGLPPALFDSGTFWRCRCARPFSECTHMDAGPLLSKLTKKREFCTHACAGSFLPPWLVSPLVPPLGLPFCPLAGAMGCVRGSLDPFRARLRDLWDHLHQQACHRPRVVSTIIMSSPWRRLGAPSPSASSLQDLHADAPGPYAKAKAWSE